MLKNKKVLILLVVVLLGGGFAAKKFVLPKPAVAKVKVNGTLYVLPKGFTLNLADGHYATLTLALLLAPGQSDGATADGTGTTDAGFGTLVQEPIVRAIVTNVITDKTEKDLLSAGGRAAAEKEILTDIKKQTDTKVAKVYFTDFAVQ